MTVSDYRMICTEELLGPLSDVEARNAPKELYVAGDTSVFDKGPRVAIVGSRKASEEGLARARKLAALLVERGVVVVSGLAEGIDTAAHTTAIERKGRTIAVIGTPLDQVYPATNSALQDRIKRDHLVISQFPPGAPIKRKNFPLRNLTMALISDATVIAEASDRSGSIGQGREALRLARGFWIMKAVVDDSSLSWPRGMLDLGARILSDKSLEEFLDSLSKKPA